MFSIREVLSLCFLFAAVVINIISIGWIYNFKKEASNKGNLLVMAGIALLHTVFLFVMHFGWSDISIINYGVFFPFLYGPLLWFATKMVQKRNFKIQQHLWHFLPFFLFSATFIYCLIYQNDHGLLKWYIPTLYFALALQLGIYLFLSIRNLIRISEGTHLMLDVKMKFFSYAILLIGMTLILFLGNGVDLLDETITYFLPAHYLIYFFLLGLSVIFQWSILLHCRKTTDNDDSFSVWEPINLANNKDETKKSVFISTTNKKKRALIALKIAGAPPELFLDRELNLVRFSAFLDEPPHLVTRTFSIELNTGFRQYVNKIKLSYAVDLLTDSKNDLSISEIAFRSGFNSDTSFYRIFKDAYHLTPRQYQKIHNKDSPK